MTFLLLQLACLAFSQSPEFVVGDVVDLQAKVVKRTAKKDRLLLVIDVKNRGPVSAEPLTFEVELDVKDAGERFTRFRYHRAGKRTWGRAGRAVAPGKTTRYFLPAPWGQDTPLKRVRVTVSRASFFRGQAAKTPPVEIVGTSTYDYVDDFTGEKSKKTEVRLRNLTDHCVTVLLALTPTTTDAVSIGHAVLKAQENVTLGSGDFAAPGSVNLIDRLDWIGLPGIFGRFRKIKIIDWSVLVGEGHGPAEELLEEAWTRRFRWSRSAKSDVEGRFTFEHQDLKANKFSGEGSFRRTEKSSSIETKRPLGASEKDSLSRAVDHAIGTLDSLSWKELMEKATVELLDLQRDGAIVWVRPKKENGIVLSLPILHLRDAEIVRGEEMAFRSYDVTTWKNVELADGRYAPSTSEVVSSNLPAYVRPLARTTSTWSLDEAEVLFPEAVTVDTFVQLTGSSDYRSRITFESVEFQESNDEGSLRGDGVAELRKAWNTPWRYPKTRRDLTGTLEIEAPNSADNWLGQKEVKGKIRISGWCGRNAEAHDGLSFEPKGRFSEDGIGQFSSLVEARLTIWTRQDFCGRASFDLEFAGCEITRGEEDGVFDIAGHDVFARVIVAGGHPVEVAEKSGLRWQRTFKTVKGKVVVVRSQCVGEVHTSTVEVDWKKCGSDSLFPAGITIKDWFHDGWGPETYTYRVR